MWTLPVPLVAALLPLCVSSALDIVTVAVGSDIVLCEMTCKPGRLCVLERLPEVITVLEYNCDSHQYKPFNKWYDRINASAASGCATIRNAQRNDTGRYEWTFYDKDGRLNVTLSARYNVMDKVSITNLTSKDSNSGLSTSLHVHFMGDQVTVTWSEDGGDLPEGHQLSDFNETLTVRNEDYGTYRVTVTNPVSEDQAERTLKGLANSSRRTMRWSWIPICVVLTLCCTLWLLRRRKREQSKAQTKQESAGNASPGFDDIESAEFTEIKCIEADQKPTDQKKCPFTKCSALFAHTPFRALTRYLKLFYKKQKDTKEDMTPPPFSSDFPPLYKCDSHIQQLQVHEHARC